MSNPIPRPKDSRLIKRWGHEVLSTLEIQESHLHLRVARLSSVELLIVAAAMVGVWLALHPAWTAVAVRPEFKDSFYVQAVHWAVYFAGTLYLIKLVDSPAKWIAARIVRAAWGDTREDLDRRIKTLKNRHKEISAEVGGLIQEVKKEGPSS